ncbi:MAG: glycosyltransferase family 9 protein [Terrimicrobiaceae bacterium]
MREISKPVETRNSKIETPKILVIRGGAIGDFLLTLPAIGLLRENFPDCHLEILGYRHIAALADGRFYANATRSIEYGPLAGFFNPKADLDPELCEYFSGFQQILSYIYDPDQLFESCLRRAGVKNLIAASPKISDGLHAAHQLARPLEQLALWLEDPAAKFFPSQEDLVEAERLLPAAAGPILALHPGSGGEHKKWPAENWRQFVETIHREFPSAHLVIVGGESDGDRLSLLRQILPPGRTTFLENLPLPVLGAVLSRCTVFVGHDSGISHLAAAAGTPCLLLFGPTDPDIWAPANQGVRVLQAPDGQLSALEVRAVLAKLKEMLADAV